MLRNVLENIEEFLMTRIHFRLCDTQRLRADQDGGGQRDSSPSVISPIPCPLTALPTMCGNLGEFLFPLESFGWDSEVGTLLYGAFHIVRTWL